MNLYIPIWGILAFIELLSITVNKLVVCVYSQINREYMKKLLLIGLAAFVCDIYASDYNYIALRA